VKLQNVVARGMGFVNLREWCALVQVQAVVELVQSPVFPNAMNVALIMAVVYSVVALQVNVVARKLRDFVDLANVKVVTITILYIFPLSNNCYKFNIKSN
jgi:hypothetical protein